MSEQCMHCLEVLGDANPVCACGRALKPHIRATDRRAPEDDPWWECRGEGYTQRGGTPQIAYVRWKARKAYAAMGQGIVNEFHLQLIEEDRTNVY